MAQVNPYLNFKGNCEEAFTFYKSVFGGEFTFIGRFKDMPAPDITLSEEEGNMIMHVSLPISKETTLFGSDVNGPWTAQFVTGNNISLSVNTESEAEAKRIFDGLSAGGQVTMPLEKTFWNAYFGMFTDKFGISWMVNYDYNTSQ